MLASNVTIPDLIFALEETNKHFSGNICFKYEPKKIGRKYRFTLRTQNSSQPGARRTTQGHRNISACWHAHGVFFAELFKINPDAVIMAADHRVTKDKGNWHDWNISSRFNPLMYSDACDCVDFVYTDGQAFDAEAIEAYKRITP